MGKSVNSCFKIISCAGSDDSVDRDEIENKGSDKRGWSFRKRSARHRVLSNTVVTEPTTLDNKEISEPITVSSEPQINSSINEKTSDSIWTEEIPDSFTKNATVSTIVTESVIEDDMKCDPIKCEPVCDESESESRSEFESESAVLVIQASVRRFLAQRQLAKHKNVVKLQAAVRGHLVRSHAVGTLRCVQAIVKMQALVRSRNAERSSIGEKKVQNPTYVSVEKLLSNRLARQLLDSTPKTKQINIKCDPSKSDSAWSWLERWMSVSSPETIETHAPEQNQDKVIKTEKEVECVVPSNVEEETVPSEEKEVSINIEHISHVKNHEEEKPVPELIEKPDSPSDEPIDLNTETPIEAIPVPENPVSETKPNPIPENPVSETKPNPIPENPVSETEPKRTSKRVATDQPDSEGRKSIFGSRKASNPAFIAAQSRFEELTSKTNPLKSPSFSNQSNEADSSTVVCSSDPLKPVSSSNQDDVADISSSDLLKPDNEVDSSAEFSAAPEKTTTATDLEPDEYSVSQSSRVVQNGGSECGTELSVTSTLDSPDRSEVENKKLEEEVIVFEEAVGAKNDNNNNNNDNSIDIIIPEKHDSIDDTETEKPKPVNNVQQKVDDSVSDADIELDPEMVPLVSGEVSPRSHITVPESQGTPSSQISTNTKKSKTDKKVSSQKRKSWSTSKKSPVRSSADSSLRSSLEQLPKDTKPQKRRNSFGSPRPDNTDHEPRDGNSNTSVPSYMQATESAKLKAIANSSPKSSPDLQDKDGYLKKRHSLPGAVNGRQGSPRIQRSMSQALQTTKGNGSQERKWQR